MSPFVLARWVMPALLCVTVVWGAKTGSPEPVINFTPEERAWIAAHPVIRAGHDPSFAPYAITDENGNIVGIDPDFLELVTKRTGLQFRHESRENWAAMLEAFKAHEVDVLGSVGSAPERASYMALTASYTFAANGIITRNNTPYLFDLRDLSGRTISVPRGYVGLLEELNQRASGHRLVEYDDPLACYRAVSRGEVFASIGNVANAAYVIKSKGLGNLRLSSIPTVSQGIYFGVRKDWPELIGIMNKVFASVTPSERMQINDRWIPMDYRHDRWWVTAFKVAAGIAGVAVVFFLVLFFYNRRLASELAERRRIQRELEETHRKLARVSEEKSELLRMVAHDLRSPLTGVVLGTDMLKADGGHDRRMFHDMLDQMRTTAQQMIRLTNDLVDVHAIEEGRHVFHWTDVDFSALLQETVAGFAERSARKSIRLRLHTEEPVMTIHSDAAALRQVADNLISNALKYSPSHTEVAIDLLRNGDGLVLLVSDQGPGISEEDRQRLFQKYARGHAVPTGGEKSTGLGLWIVQRIVAGLHGQVRCENGRERGATFIVELPSRAKSA
jgi:polar amino acid transport system substrate-binding protein